MKLTKKTVIFSIVVFTMMLMLSFSSSAALKPSKPTGVKAEATAADKVSLTWKKTADADYYRVYIKQDGKWKAVKNPKTNKCEISGLAASKTYDLAVRSVNKSGGKNYICDGYTAVRVKTKALSGTTLSASASADYADLSWKKVPGATGYYVYIRTDGNWKRLKALSSEGLTYHVNKLKPDTVYQFCIRPITSGDGKTVAGPKSNIVKLRTLGANKVNAKVTGSNASSVTLTWSRAADASGYKIFRLAYGKWKGVKTVNSRDTLKAVITSLESDSKYTFLVRAFRKTSDGVLWFVAGERVVATTDPTTKNLKVTRTKKLSELLKGKSFTLYYKTQTAGYGDIPVRIFKSGENYRLDTRMNEITYVLFNTKKADYIFLPEKKLYVKLPFTASGATDIKSAVDALLPESDWNARASLAEFGGRKVVCEAYTDILKTNSVRYYYRAGELVGIEQYNAKGKLIERATVAQISGSARASLFQIPDGYKEIK